MQGDISILKIPMIWHHFEYENTIKSCKRLKMFFEISVKDTYEWFDSVVRKIV